VGVQRAPAFAEVRRGVRQLVDTALRVTQPRIEGPRAYGRLTE
jgi:hypothetical protein